MAVFPKARFNDIKLLKLDTCLTEDHCQIPQILRNQTTEDQRLVVENVQLLSQKFYPTCGRVGEHHEEKTHHGLKAVRMS